MKRCLYLLLVLTALPGLAQNSVIENLKPKLSPQSPNVAALGRYGEHPVSMYTGVPNISIPLFDIQAGSIKVPVSLSYHAGGHRVTDQASWVGLGWSLNAGGIITRNVIGRADEAGILNTPLDTTINASDASSEAVCANTYFKLEQYNNGLWDTGYDIFSFSLPNGKSGKFILRPTSSLGSMVMLMPYERIKIEYTRAAGSGALMQFKIIDEDGIVYTFADREVTDTGNNPVVSAWQLTSVQGTRPLDEVRFYYDSTATSSTYTDWSETQTVIDQIVENSSGCGVNPGLQLGTTASVNTVSTPKLLREIVFPGGKLNFLRDVQPRTDIPAIRALDRVQIWGLNAAGTEYVLIKVVDLQHGYFADPTGGYGGRPPLRLEGVVMRSSDGTSVGRYSFGYNDAMPLPGPTSKSRDIWGYYNGKPNTTLIPAQVVTLEGGDGGTVTVGGADRSCSEAHMQAWILTRITYPTGGYGEFYYEANRYNDNGVKLAGGLRVARIETRASVATPIQVKTYRYGVNESGVGRLNVVIASAFWVSSYNNKISGACVNYRTRVYGSNYNASLVPFDGSPVTYSEVAEYQGTVTANAGKTIQNFSDSRVDALVVLGTNTSKNFVQSFHWERGLNTVQASLAAVGSPVKKTVNVYSNPTDASGPFIGLLIHKPNVYPNGAWFWTNNCLTLKNEYPINPTYYSWRLGNVRLVKTQDYTYPSSGIGEPVVTTQETDYNADYLPKKYRTYGSDGTVLTKRVRYPSDYTLPTGPTGFAKGIQVLKNRGMRSTVIEEYSFRSRSAADTNRVLTGGKLTFFEEPSNVAGYAFPKEVHMLDVLNGCCNRNTYVPAVFSNTGVTRHSRYSRAITFNSYDANGNLLEYTPESGAKTQFTWLNLTRTINGFTSRFSVLSQETANPGGTPSLATTYAYDVPLLGLKLQTASSGIVTSYTYDLFGRLASIRDGNGKVLKSYRYDYALK